MSPSVAEHRRPRCRRFTVPDFAVKGRSDRADVRSVPAKWWGWRPCGAPIAGPELVRGWCNDHAPPPEGRCRLDACPRSTLFRNTSSLQEHVAPRGLRRPPAAVSSSAVAWVRAALDRPVDPQCAMTVVPRRECAEHRRAAAVTVLPARSRRGGRRARRGQQCHHHRSRRSARHGRGSCVVGAPRLPSRRAPRHRRARITRARASRHPVVGPRVAHAAHHGEPRAGRCAQDGIGARTRGRARRARSERPASRGRARRRRRARRARPRRCGPARRGHPRPRRFAGAFGAHLGGGAHRQRERGGAGRRCARAGGATPGRIASVLEGRGAVARLGPAVPRARRHARRRRRPRRSGRGAGPPVRTRRAGGRSRGRSPPAHVGTAGYRQDDAGAAAAHDPRPARAGRGTRGHAHPLRRGPTHPRAPAARPADARAAPHRVDRGVGRGRQRAAAPG